MVENVVRTRVKAIENSLIYSIRLLVSMDSAAGIGGVLLIPDVFIWTLEQINPSLTFQLREFDLPDKFRQRLSQYQELRVLAEPLRFDNHLRAEAEMCTELQDFDYLGLSDIQYALDYGDWHPNDRSARLCFLRVLRGACAMPYPDDEMATDLGKPQPLRAIDSLTAMEHLVSSTEDTSFRLNPQMLETLEIALEHIRCELVASDDGRTNRHWANVYTSILGA